MKTNGKYAASNGQYTYVHLGIVMKQLSGGLAPRTYSTSPPATSISALSEAPGLNTTLDANIQFMNLDAAECSRRRCSDNGRCEEIGGETTCVCSQGYRGGSCQEHVLKTMQGPIVYGAAGLCVCVVIIVAAVMIKRKRASTRFLFFFYQLWSYHSHLLDPII